MSRITLHEEIAAILSESGRAWMTIAELADEVNRRGRYQKRDGSSVSPFQIHGRTRNYAKLFDRDGSRVSLRRSELGVPTRAAPAVGIEHVPVAARVCEPIDPDELVALLIDAARRVHASAWPGELRIDGAGLYTWWTDAAGAADLSHGLGHPIADGLIYAGQTGGTTVGGIQRLATLRSRIGGNHLRGRVRGSTFRLTLASVLLAPLGLEAEGPKRLTPASEARLSAWMRRHLSVCTALIEDRAAIMRLEHAILRQLDPPLNLEGMAPTSLRARVTYLRRELGGR